MGNEEKEKGLNENLSPITHHEEIVAKNELKIDEIKSNSHKNKISYEKPLDEYKSDLELFNANQIDEIRKKYSTPYKFSSKFLNDFFSFVFKHRKSNFRQIEIKGLHNISALLAFMGQPIMPFYLLDVSDSSTGKSSNNNFQNNIIFEIISSKLEQINKPTENDKDKNMRFIIDTKVSIEAIFEVLFEGSKTLYITLPEAAGVLNSANPMYADVINFLTDKHGLSTLVTPTFKTNMKKMPSEFTDVKLYFYGDTNIQQLGDDSKLIKENLGGIVNRVVFVYTKNLMPYESALTLPYDNEEAQEFRKYICDLANFYSCFNENKNFCKINMNSINDNEIYQSYAKPLFYKQQEEGVEFKELYNRADYNLLAIIQVLHYVKEYECYTQDNDYKFNENVDDETIKEAITFFDYYIQNIQLFINELNKNILDITKARNDILNFIAKQNKEVKIKDILHIFHKKYDLNADTVRNILDGYIEFKPPIRGNKPSTISRIL
ncbi:hypothetical protein [Campylobacter ureolyticus]|uniref:DUF3987 domain-containing protein n=1 Tax=Campylobacter ureolyticus TaxID=827 RepID=A0A6N2RVM8_9BACT